MAKSKYASRTKSTNGRRRYATRSKSRTTRRKAKMIESPASGRWIRIGGPAYNDLLRMGYTDAQLRKRKSSVRKRQSRRYAKNSGVKSLGTRRKMRVSRASRSSTRGRGRGSRTKGWGKASPKRGRPRQRLMKECGSKCFLDPKHEAFPICAKLSGSKSSGSCKIDCRGLQAAIIRASQWGYTDIEKKARKLYREKCGRK